MLQAAMTNLLMGAAAMSNLLMSTTREQAGRVTSVNVDFSSS